MTWGFCSGVACSAGGLSTAVLAGHSSAGGESFAGVVHGLLEGSGVPPSPAFGFSECGWSKTSSSSVV